MKKKKVSKKRPTRQSRRSVVAKSPNTIEHLPFDLPTAGATDTATVLVEIYEAVERAYRAAVMASKAHPRLTHTTNF